MNALAGTTYDIRILGTSRASIRQYKWCLTVTRSRWSTAIADRWGIRVTIVDISTGAKWRLILLVNVANGPKFARRKQRLVKRIAQGWWSHPSKDINFMHRQTIISIYFLRCRYGICDRPLKVVILVLNCGSSDHLMHLVAESGRWPTPSDRGIDQRSDDSRWTRQQRSSDV